MYRAGLPTPGARLLQAANLVRPGARVADIGCDHGKLAVYLARSGKSPFVVAVDMRPLPLQGAKALVRQTGCGKTVSCRLGNGLAPVLPGEVDDVVIAGMSGETMIEIMQAAPWVRTQAMHFVFLPATRAAQLRCWLMQNGFALQKEAPIAERGYFYTAISVNYTGQPVKAPAPLLCEVGLLPRVQNEAAAGYITQRLQDLQNRLRAPLPVNEKQQLLQLISEVKQCQTQMTCGTI